VSICVVPFHRGRESRDHSSLYKKKDLSVKWLSAKARRRTKCDSYQWSASKSWKAVKQRFSWWDEQTLTGDALRMRCARANLRTCKCRWQRPKCPLPAMVAEISPELALIFTKCPKILMMKCCYTIISFKYDNIYNLGIHLLSKAQQSVLKLMNRTSHPRVVQSWTLMPLEE
jgi:hypothetical protein